MISKATLFSVGTVFFLAAGYGAMGGGGHDHDGGEISMEGHFGLDSKPDPALCKKFMTEMGFSEQFQKMAAQIKRVLIGVHKVNETHCTVRKITPMMQMSMTFQPGVEFDAEFPDGRKFKNTITVDMKTHTATRVLKMEGFEAKCVAKFCPKGVNVTATAKTAVINLHFKRLMGSHDNEEDMEKMKKEYFGADYKN